MNRKLVLALFVVFLLGILGATYSTPKVRGSTIRSFHLFGSLSHGWNSTTPGPTILAEQGDTVNLTLTSADSLPHKFFLSYHNSTGQQPDDPQPSLDFTGTIVYQFTATNTLGTYTYYCLHHPTTMYGALKVVPSGSIPEFPSFVLLPLSMVATLLAVIVTRREKSKSRNHDSS
jgi:FtsP/CotA-like multicopper oxidase with cupredoxin domain